MSAPLSTSSSRAGRAVAGAGAFAVVGLGLSALYATTGVGVPCPFRALTGWLCPFCGGTRMGAALLHGDVGTAFLLSPASFVVVVVVGVLGVLGALRLAGGPVPRLPARLARWAAEVPVWHWLAGGLGLAVAWTCLRNLI